MSFLSGLFESSPAKTTSTLPKELSPYVTDVLSTAKKVYSTPYTAYTGEMTAGMTPDQLAAYSGVRSLGGNANAPEAEAAIHGSMEHASGIADLNPYQFSEYQFSDPGTFDADAAHKYMNPYIQNVLDTQKTQAQRDYESANQSRKASAINAGAFGGSGRFVSQGLAENDWLNRMNSIEATGMSNAYTDAERQYEADRAARMATEKAQAGEQSRVQSSQAADNLNYANLGMTADRFNLDAAGQLAALGQQDRGNTVQNFQLLESAGKSEQAQKQAEDDARYQAWLTQQQYPSAQVKDYASIVAGSPLANTGTTTQKQASGSPIQQLLGLGLSAIGLNNAMKNG